MPPIPPDLAAQQAVATLLDELLPIDSRREAECRLARVELLARGAVREARAAQLTQAQIIPLLLRLWSSG